eukprot:scaffold25288_cov112-Isochrysis_galbana.AAC.7
MQPRLSHTLPLLRLCGAHCLTGVTPASGGRSRRPRWLVLALDTNYVTALTLPRSHQSTISHGVRALAS